MLLLLMVLTNLTAWAITGSGTQIDPYVISSVDDWNTFANSNNASTYWDSDVYVRLGADIGPVTTMVGTSDYKYEGIFDGLGHTLTVNLTHSSGGDALVAPFKYISRATIKRLHTAGTITTDGKMAGGIVGDVSYSSIENCQSSVTINTSVDGDGTHGGLVGRVSDGSLTITNCLFDGSITGNSTNSCGGFVGWVQGFLVLKNCLQAGNLSGIGSEGGATFHRAETGHFASFNTCYYKTAYGEAQGTQTDATGSTLQGYLGDGWEVKGNDVVPIMTANPRNLAEATISGLLNNYQYTGSVISIDFPVKDANGQTLIKDQDYTVTFSPATVQEVGNYTLTITGTGNETAGYFGTIIQTFTVMPWGDGTIGGYCGVDDPATDGVDESQNVWYELSNDHKALTISGTGAMSSSCSWENDCDYHDITSVVIEDGVTNIGDNVFSFYSGLTSVTIGSGVTSIGNYAFRECTNLTSVTCASGSQLTSIGNQAFWFSGLTSITIPASVETIGDKVFSGCSNLSTITVDGGNTVYDSRNNSNAIIETSSNTLVAGCKGTTIPYGVTSIGFYALYCSGLRSIAIPTSVESIGTSAFAGCTGLTSVTIGSGVTSIGHYAFEECTNLTSVTIPASVTIIGQKAFFDCSSQASVTVYASTPPTLSNYVFKTDGPQIYVFSDYENAYKSAWSNYASKITAMTNLNGKCGDTNENEGADVRWVLTGNTLTIMKVGSTGAMADYASADDQPWKDYRSSITAVVIENGVTSIGNNAFNGCSNLTIVYMQSSAPQITTWGTDAFTNCDANLVIAVPAAAYNSYNTALVGNSYQLKLRKNIATCSAIVPNPIYNNAYHGYFYDGSWNDNHGGIEVYDGATLLTYGTDYRFSMLESLDGGSCENLGEHCRVILSGEGAYAGTLTADVVIEPNTVTDASWGTLTWNLDGDGKFTITGTGAMNAATDYTKYPWYAYGSNITSITIGANITSVAAGAFGGDNNTNTYAGVTTVSLPMTLETIGDGAFAYCTGATITIPTSVTTLGDNPFNQVGCVVLSTPLIDGNDNSDIITKIKQAKTVTFTYKRTFSQGVASTVCLPFAHTPNGEGTYYTFTAIDKDASPWTVTMTSTAASLEANKPYMFMPASTGEVTFSGTAVFDLNLSSNTVEDPVITEGRWNLIGTYESRIWDGLNNTDEIGSVYGFAAQHYDGSGYTVEPGNFVKAASGASIAPFRAYLKYTTVGQQNASRRGAADNEALPSRLSVRLVDADGILTAIGTIDTKTGEVRFDSEAWYTLDGRRLNSAPSTSGIYIKNGKKVIVKDSRSAFTKCND